MPWTTPLPHRFQFTPPRRGATNVRYSNDTGQKLFQFTPPRRGATLDNLEAFAGEMHFNSRPREGGRHCQAPKCRILSFISIHAPAKGGDLNSEIDPIQAVVFQFTPPRRGATYACGKRRPVLHYFNSRPREGGRLFQMVIVPESKHFNSRPREGGRLAMSKRWASISLFQFTPPRRGATVPCVFHRAKVQFQFTPPRRGAT